MIGREGDSQTYTLHVTFKSNEHPWSTEYRPSAWIAKDDSAALRWAYGMQEGMGSNYICVLKRDGVPIYDGSKPIAEMVRTDGELNEIPTTEPIL